jgi:hypothetical protein
MIIQVILIAIVIIIWLQYPQIKKTDKNKDLHLKIFDIVKIPVIVICFIIIIYILSGMDECSSKEDLIKNVNVHMSMPKF